MAETTYTGGGDLRLAAVLAARAESGEMMKLAAEIVDLRPQIKRVVPEVPGSLAVKVSLAGLYSDKFAAANTDETTDPSHTVLSDSSATITAARQVLFRRVSDLFGMTGGPSPDEFIQAMAISAGKRFTAMICALFSSLTQEAGTVGVPFTVDTFYSALNTVESAGGSGRFAAILTTGQWSNFRSSLRGESVIMPETVSMLNAGPLGYKGKYANVDIWVTSEASTGCIFDLDAFGYVELETDLLTPPSGHDRVILPGNVYCDIQHHAAGAETDYVGNWIGGVATIQSSLAVEILSS